jgi:Nucleotidyl transferase AbiEii toxin, Type IV TA system
VIEGRYATARAFRQALDERLRRERERSSRPLDQLRKRVLIERLLARLFAEPAAPWLLKGGYALELRYRPRARTTRDVDLAVEHPGGSLPARLDGLRAALQRAARADLGDFLRFDIGLGSELPGPPDGGGRL